MVLAVRSVFNKLDFTQLVPYFQVVLSALLGGFIGLEREHVGKSAGTRTYSLVAIGSTLFTIISLKGFGSEGVVIDPSRVAAQVVTGIGFLGAGLIIHRGSRVRGLTTAAAMWAVSAIGVAVGVGFYLEAVFSALLIFFVLYILGRTMKME